MVVDLRLYDTATRSTRPFEALQPGEVSIYYCGATVQGDPHVGHARSAVCFDILRRWLEYQGETVRLVRNVTDIDDKILHKAAEAGEPSWAWAYTYEQIFDAAYDLLGVLSATYAPRATGHIPEMVNIITRLIQGGHAYASAGSVYFDVQSWPHYGRLSGQTLANMQETADVPDQTKRDPRDFALWKGAPLTERGWETPWGYGRPGWHLECSAMATRYCGAQFDIHGGGLDLVFPHHENEIAQSNAAGDGFANYWLHNHWVTTAGEKMSKSLGNSLTVAELVRVVRPIELRYYLSAAHYRSVIEFAESSLQDAATGFRRIESFVLNATALIGPNEVGRVSPEFADAMNDDIGVPAALAALHGAVTAGNSALASGDQAAAARLLASVRAMARIIGVDPLDPTWTTGARSDEAAIEALGVLVDALLADRETARAAKDFQKADEIRSALTQAGINIEDGAGHSRWTLAR